MGYSYDMKNRLCCDKCGRSGGVLKRKCPHGYCQAWAVCPACWKDKEFRIKLKASHVGCKEAHLECVKRDEERKTLIAEGKWVRCSALNAKAHGVHVLFTNDMMNRGTVGRYMPSVVYEAFPLLDNVTIEMYEEKAGMKLEEAPSEYDWSDC